MNSYERMVGYVNKLYYEDTTTISPDAIVYDNCMGFKMEFKEFPNS